jgi:hypothetical protein
MKMDDTAAALLGAVIGAFAVSVPPFILSAWQYSKERRALASALAAEIEAYIMLMDLREHVERAEKAIEQLKSGRDVDLSQWGDPTEDAIEPFIVMRANLTSIGKMADASGELATFYALVTGIRTTAANACHGRYERLTLQEKVKLIEDELRLWDRARIVAAALLPKLRRMR